MLLYLGWKFDQRGAAERQDHAAAARGGGEALAAHHCRGALAALFPHATYAWGNQAEYPDKSHLCLGSQSSSPFT